MDVLDQKILNNYLKLLNELSPGMKLNLIEQLKESMEMSKPKESQLEKAFGSWNSDESAEELIKLIKSSRTSNRKVEGF